MTTPKKSKKGKPASPKKFPSRDNYKSLYLPKHVYSLVELVAQQEDRSVSYMAKRLIEEALRVRGIDPHKPEGGAE